MEFLSVLTEAAFSLRTDKNERRYTTSVSTIQSGIHGMGYLAQSQLSSLGRAVENVRGYVEEFCNSLASETVDLILLSSHEAGVTRKSDRHEQTEVGSHIWKSGPTKSRGK